MSSTNTPRAPKRRQVGPTEPTCEALPKTEPNVQLEKPSRHRRILIALSLLVPAGAATEVAYESINSSSQVHADAVCVFDTATMTDVCTTVTTATQPTTHTTHPQVTTTYHPPVTTTYHPPVTTTTLPPKDSDHDRIPDNVEAFLGTNPNKADTDGDGWPDGEEIYMPGGKTIKSPKELDSNGNGIISPLDACEPSTKGVCDIDGDGLTYTEEVAKGTDPAKKDTDGDGVGDKTDQQNKKPSAGETVDANGVIIKVTTPSLTTPETSIPETIVEASTTVASSTASSTTLASTTPGSTTTIAPGEATHSGTHGNNRLAAILAIIGLSGGVSGGFIVLAKRHNKKAATPAHAPTRPRDGQPRPGVVGRAKFDK
jgi:hypothetical protein